MKHEMRYREATDETAYKSKLGTLKQDLKQHKRRNETV